MKKWLRKVNLKLATPQKWIKIKQIREFNKIQEILRKRGNEFFQIDEEMTEKNEAEDGNSISLKRPVYSVFLTFPEYKVLSSPAGGR